MCCSETVSELECYSKCCLKLVLRESFQGFFFSSKFWSIGEKFLICFSYICFSGGTINQEITYLDSLWIGSCLWHSCFESYSSLFGNRWWTVTEGKLSVAILPFSTSCCCVQVGKYFLINSVYYKQIWSPESLVFVCEITAVWSFGEQDNFQKQLGSVAV